MIALLIQANKRLERALRPLATPKASATIVEGLCFFSAILIAAMTLYNLAWLFGWA